VKPLPATRSFTVWDTSTCDGPASAAIRARRHRDASALPVDELTLTRVHAGAYLKAEIT